MQRLKKEGCRSPLHQAAASPLQQPRKQPRFSALRALTLKILESEIQAAAEHSEIIPGSIDHAKTQVVSPTEVPCEPKFETGAKLAEEFGFAAEMVGLRIHSEGVRRSLRVKLVPFAAAENRTETSPCIRRQTRARNWVPQRKRAKNSADGMIVIDSLFSKYRDRLVLENIETRLAGVECKSLNTDPSIAAEEIF